MMGSLTEALGLHAGSVAAVVGCGGKTSLIGLLAEENRHRRVLISPTTQMYPMEGSVGVYQEATGKLASLPAQVLAAAAPLYDLCLLEADGSNGLPCKGWRQDEPVVPAYCTHTLGVVTLAALGRPANEEVCLRLPLFLALTGLQQGEPIHQEAMARMVCRPQGMFQHSRGKRFLLVNQVETDGAEALAREWLTGIQATRSGFFDGYLYGSVHMGRWQQQ